LALDFKAAWLTPLTDDHVRALEYLTAGWSRPDGARGAASSTMGPQAYRRRRRRLATVAAGVLASVVLLVPGVLAAVALYQGDTARLSGFGEALPYILAAAALLSTIGAAISRGRDGASPMCGRGSQHWSKANSTSSMRWIW
jgi:hypothetical protein